jgi:hypothetical protein
MYIEINKDDTPEDIKRKIRILDEGQEQSREQRFMPFFGILKKDKFDARKFSGALNFDDDALTIQKKLRGERE